MLIVRAMAAHVMGASVWACHDYRTVWVLTDKLREVMFLDQEDVQLVDQVEIIGAYLVGYLTHQCKTNSSVFSTDPMLPGSVRPIQSAVFTENLELGNYIKEW